MDTKGPNGEFERKLLDAGENEPGGVRIWYWLKDKPESEVSLTFVDADGNDIRAIRAGSRKRMARQRNLMILACRLKQE